MSLSEDIRQHRIVIQDTVTDRAIADATILKYDAGTGEIEIDADQAELSEGAAISALIFTASGLYESHGVVRDKDGTKVRIALYEGMAHDARQAVRYQVNISGEVDSVTGPQTGKRPGGFEITILNMSSIGLLLQAPAGKIKEGDTIRILTSTKGQRIIITADVNRVEDADQGREHVGCSIRLVNLG
ncbi:MAG: PilZ domain-containing protein [Clostridium sp.]|nr:PilZ domain-containing protein [Acetatifactor muris]MCM1526973.1 PilZ domain-containing protein [Bacteroides sp.]MCM1563136.1 PilZ domain-containing protein [Clostridium sp.]